MEDRDLLLIRLLFGTISPYLHTFTTLSPYILLIQPKENPKLCEKMLLIMPNLWAIPSPSKRLGGVAGRVVALKRHRMVGNIVYKNWICQ